MSSNNITVPELETVQEDSAQQEKDKAREVNIQNGYSDEVYERCIIHPVTNTTLH